MTTQLINSSCRNFILNEIFRMLDVKLNINIYFVWTLILSNLSYYLLFNTVCSDKINIQLLLRGIFYEIQNKYIIKRYYY